MTELNPLPPTKESVDITQAWNKLGQALYTAKAVKTLVFGILWLFVTGIIAGFFLVPLSEGRTVEYTYNGRLTTVSLEDTNSLIQPTILIGALTLVGFLVIGTSAYQLYRLHKLRQQKS